MLKKRVNLFGVWVDDISMNDALALAEDSLTFGRARSFFTPNLEFIDGARRSENIKTVLNSASVSLPDGFSLRVLSALLGTNINNTVAGVDFGENLVKLAAETGKGIFLLGGKEGVARAAAKKLQNKFSDLIICGAHHGYFSADELEDLYRKINASGAEILVVCRGFPRQEKFVFDSRFYLPNVKIFACLGGALDIWSGGAKRAPLFIRCAHLEWLWRIICEPQRAERFFFSLPTLFCALGAFLNRCASFLGIKLPKRAYTQTDAFGR